MYFLVLLHKLPHTDAQFFDWLWRSASSQEISFLIFYILISRSRPASATHWRYIVLTLYLTTATTLRTSKLSILSTNTTATSCTKFNLRCKTWIKNERKEVIWHTPTLSQDGYLMEFRPEQLPTRLSEYRMLVTSLYVCFFAWIFSE